MKSVRGAVQACDGISVQGKKIEVIGDIAEVGIYTELAHLELVNYINSSGFDV